MKKRLKFKCWSCPKTYTLKPQITPEQTLIVACPYCNSEAIVDLKPYSKTRKTVMRSDEENEAVLGWELELPDVLDTQKPE